MMIAAAVVALAGVLSPRAWGEPPILPAASGETAEGTHGWLVAPESPKGDWFLLHFPPRERVGADGVAHGAPPGGARVATRLKAAPEAIAAFRGTVYLIYPAEQSEAGPRREVLSLSAVASGVGDLWAYEPANRLRARPAIMRGGVIAGVGSGSNGPTVRVDEGEGSVTLELVGDAWEERGAADGLGPSVRAGGRALAWAPEGPSTLVLFGAGAELARVEAPAAGWGVVGMNAEDLVIVAWTESVPASGGSNASRFRVMVSERSGSTGLEVYRGVPRSLSPVTPGSFRLLVMMVLGISIGSLVILLRTGDAEEAIPFPPDAAMAEPWRRGLATVLDGGVAWWLAGAILGVRVGEALSPLGVLTHLGPMLVVTQGMAWLVGSLSEAGFGRTPGKLLTGCAVVGWTGGGAPGRPRLWQAAARNAVKWVFPPVAALGLLDSSGRHRGEVVTRTAVVVWVEREEEEP